jgi:hypothetical protein
MRPGFVWKILLLALAVRLLAFAAATQGAFIIGEGRMQAELASNLLHGRGLMISRDMLSPESNPNARATSAATFEFFRRVDGFYGAMRPEQPTMFLVPGHPVFAAGVFAVFGDRNYLAVRGVQLLLGLGTVFLGWLIARRFLAGRWLALAGIFFALDPFEIYYEAVPATQALFSLTLLLAIHLTLGLMDHLSRPEPIRVRRALLCGASWAASFYVRPAALPLMVWMLLMLPFSGWLSCGAGIRDTRETRGIRTPGLPRLFSGRGLATALLAGGAFMLLLLPWGIRNQGLCGTFRIMPAQGGVNLWEYNGRIFTSHFDGEAEGAMLLYGDLRESSMEGLNSPELAEFPEFRDEPEWVRDEVLLQRNLTFMLRNPVLTLRLITLRFVEFFKPFPLNSFSPVYTIAGLLAFSWVLLFLWGGAWIAVRRHGAAGIYLATAAAGYALMHILTASGTPHRVAMDFPMAILAIIGLRHCGERLRLRRSCRRA